MLRLDFLYNKHFIAGISFSTDEQSLREAFSKYGEVVEGRLLGSFISCTNAS